MVWISFTDPLSLGNAVPEKQDEIEALLAMFGGQCKFKRNFILKEMIFLSSKQSAYDLVKKFLFQRKYFHLKTHVWVVLQQQSWAYSIFRYHIWQFMKNTDIIDSIKVFSHRKLLEMEFSWAWARIMTVNMKYNST